MDQRSSLEHVLGKPTCHFKPRRHQATDPEMTRVGSVGVWAQRKCRSTDQKIVCATLISITAHGGWHFYISLKYRTKYRITDQMTFPIDHRWTVSQNGGIHINGPLVRREVNEWSLELRLGLNATERRGITEQVVLEIVWWFYNCCDGLVFGMARIESRDRKVNRAKLSVEESLVLSRHNWTENGAPMLAYLAYTGVIRPNDRYTLPVVSWSAAVHKDRSSTIVIKEESLNEYTEIPVM
ncbi:hypothetical protein Tco_0484140 [Tanacetum coccineum]